MSRFLIFYFVAYGGANLYFYLKLKRALPLSKKIQLLLIPLILALFLAPLIARSLESLRLETLPELLSQLGYLWMGLLFLFVTAALFMDLCNMILSRTALKSGPKAVFVFCSAYTAVVGTYGYFEATHIVTEHISLSSRLISAAGGKIRIVQISDVHAGQIVREKRIKAIMHAVEAVSPDILVSTGDLVDGHQKHLSRLEQLFLVIKPPMGKYAILGNHEYYVGEEQSVKFMKDAGFIVLKNESFDVGGRLCITGVIDSRKQNERIANAVVEQKLLDAAPQGEFRLLLKHRPAIEKSSEGKFDLMLSGHVHKGQIFPFNLLTWLSFPVRTGLSELKNGSHLYVSRGTGVWGPPIRFLAPPEVTVIDLIPESH